MTASGPTRRRSARLWVWLVSVLTVAMLPLAGLGVTLSWSLAREADQMARQALLARTEAAAGPVRSSLQQALGATDGLGAAVMADPDDVDRCNRVLREFVLSHPNVAFAGFVTAQGLMTCSSTGETRDFSQSELFLSELRNQRPVFQVSRRGSVTQRSIIGAIMPILRNGEMRGFVFLSLPNDAGAESWQHAGGGDVDVITLNLEGEIMTASGSLDEAADHLPEGYAPSELAQRVGQSFAARDALGESRYYAISDLIPGKVVVVGSYPVSEARSAWGRWQFIAPVALPLAIWAAGVLGALVALRWLVLRHLTGLVSAMGRYARGDRHDPPLLLTHPPAEFAEAEAAFLEMASTLTQAERQAERDLADKTILLREVHHRVKNNLQLIASITHLQARSAEQPETREILRGLQRRVRGLASVHVALSSARGEARVNARDLVREVIAEAGGDLRADLVDLWLYPDQAVPFAMFVTEALGSHAVDGAGAPRSFSLSLGDEVVHLELQFTGGATTGSAATRLSARLIEAFAQQLEGSLTQSETPEGVALYLTFVPRVRLQAPMPVTVS